MYSVSLVLQLAGLNSTTQVNARYPCGKAKSSQFLGEQLAIVEIAKGAKGHSKQ
jgi:hypothetical protein